MQINPITIILAELDLSPQAALGSVPRSLADLIATNATNITSILNIQVAAFEAHVQRFTYRISQGVAEVMLCYVEQQSS